MSADEINNNVGENLTDLQKQLVEAMFNNAMNITKSCGNCGIDRSTFYEWQSKNPAFKAAIDDARKRLFQAAENPFFNKLFGVYRTETKTETINGQEKKTVTKYFVEPCTTTLLRALAKNRKDLNLDDADENAAPRKVVVRRKKTNDA